MHALVAGLQFACRRRNARCQLSAERSRQQETQENASPTNLTYMARNQWENRQCMQQPMTGSALIHEADDDSELAGRSRLQSHYVRISRSLPLIRSVLARQCVLVVSSPTSVPSPPEFRLLVLGCTSIRSLGSEPVEAGRLPVPSSRAHMGPRVDRKTITVLASNLYPRSTEVNSALAGAIRVLCRRPLLRNDRECSLPQMPPTSARQGTPACAIFWDGNCRERHSEAARSTPAVEDPDFGSRTCEARHRRCVR